MPIDDKQKRKSTTQKQASPLVPMCFRMYRIPRIPMCLLTMTRASSQGWRHDSISNDVYLDVRETLCHNDGGVRAFASEPHAHVLLDPVPYCSSVLMLPREVHVRGDVPKDAQGLVPLPLAIPDARLRVENHGHVCENPLVKGLAVGALDVAEGLGVAPLLLEAQRKVELAANLVIGPVLRAIVLVVHRLDELLAKT